MNIPFLSSTTISVIGLVCTTYLGMFSFNASAAGTPTPAALLEFARVDNMLVFTVVSTGCTHKDHFVLEFPDAAKQSDSSDNKPQQTLTITLLRIKQDFCRRMPGPRIIEFQLPEDHAHNGPIIINNPFITLQARTRQ